MNNIILKFLVILFLFPNLSFGQPEKKADVKLVGVSEKDIKALFNEVLLATPSLKSKENQMFILINIIDLMWGQDREKAKQLTFEIAENLQKELQPEEVSETMFIYPPIRFGRLRQNLIKMLAGHDLNLALKMKSFTEPLLVKISPTDPKKKIQLRNWSNRERDLEQRIAFQVAKEDLGKAKKTGKRKP